MGCCVKGVMHQVSLRNASSHQRSKIANISHPSECSRMPLFPAAVFCEHCMFILSQTQMMTFGMHVGI